VLFAERSRVHDVGRAARRARRVLPQAGIGVLPGVSHHGVPTARPGELDRRLADFLDGAGSGPAQAALGTSL
jgi:hypothetical protein